MGLSELVLKREVNSASPLLVEIHHLSAIPGLTELPRDTRGTEGETLKT